MRSDVDPQKIEQLMTIMGKEAHGSGRICFTECGQISFYHYDFTAQALSKISGGFERDINDVQAMYEQQLFSVQTLRSGFEAIKPELIRFPSLDADELSAKVESLAKLLESSSSENQS